MCQKHKQRNCIIPPYMEKLLPPLPLAENTLLTTSRNFREQRKSADKSLKGMLSNVRISVYDADHTNQIPGKLVGDNHHQPTKDNLSIKAYQGALHTYNFFLHQYGRASIDGRNMEIKSTVHYLRNYNNAFWDGNQMVYGCGDSKIFNPFVCDLDIIGHELTHGVIQYSAALPYQNQSGALNESFADVFGILIRQWVDKEPVRNSDWLIGRTTLIGNNFAIRSLRAPGSAYRNHSILGNDPQPGHMSQYDPTPDDNGGVHINSGIPNFAFYRTAYEIGGNAWEKAGKIWYEALTNELTQINHPNFQSAYIATFERAGKLYGANSLEQRAVRTGWEAAGVFINS